MERTKKSGGVDVAPDARMHFNLIPILFCGVLILATPQTETVTVLQVIDGDTCRLEDGRHVRYLGINAPEKGDPLFDEATQAQ